MIRSPARFASPAAGTPTRFAGRRRANGIDELESYGLPLGLIAGSEYEDRTAVLEPGDFLVVYTDGLVEALNADREMYGFDGARQYLARTSGELTSAQGRLDRCLSDMRRFVDGERLHDDVTLVTLQVLGDHHPGTDTSAREVEWTSGL